MEPNPTLTPKKDPNCGGVNGKKVRRGRKNERKETQTRKIKPKN